MPKFTRKVEFAAFQFQLPALVNMDPYDIEDVVAKEFPLTDICTAHVTGEGNLSVTLRTYGEKENFELKDGYWLANVNGFKVFTDEEFKQIATLA